MCGEKQKFEIYTPTLIYIYKSTYIHIVWCLNHENEIRENLELDTERSNNIFGFLFEWLCEWVCAVCWCIVTCDVVHTAHSHLASVCRMPNLKNSLYGNKTLSFLLRTIRWIHSCVSDSVILFIAHSNRNRLLLVIVTEQYKLNMCKIQM